MDYDLDKKISEALRKKRKPTPAIKNIIRLDKSELDENKVVKGINMNNYDVCSPHQLIHLPLNTYIRFELKSNELPGGGRMKKIEPVSDKSHNITLLVRVPRKGRKNIIYNTKDVKTVYRLKDSIDKKGKSSQSVVKNEMLENLGDKLLFDDKETLVARLDVLEARSQKMEDDLRQMFQLIKRMYQRKG